MALSADSRIVDQGTRKAAMKFPQNMPMFKVMGGRVRNILLALLALAPSARLAWTWRAMPHLGMSHDDALYLVSAQSLAQSHGYRIESLPGQPFQTKYPPMFPILLALAWKISPSFPENLPVAMLIAWLMLLPLVFFIHALFRNFGLAPDHPRC